MNPKQPRPIIDLFAGVGGFSFGLMEANYYPLRAFEIEEEVASIYNSAYDACAPVGAHKVEWPRVMKHHQRFPGGVALVVGDAEFNPKRYRHAYYFFKAVREIVPMGFAFITDMDFLSQDDLRVWRWRSRHRRILDDYRWGYQPIRYHEMGVPIVKERALVFGVHQDCEILGFEDPKQPLYMEFPKVEIPSPHDLFDLLPYPGKEPSSKITGQTSNWAKVNWKPAWPMRGDVNLGHHPYYERRITLREKARILGLPDILEIPERCPSGVIAQATPTVVAQMIGAWFLRVNWIYKWSEARVREGCLKPTSVNYAEKNRKNQRRRLSTLFAARGRRKRTRKRHR